MIAFILPSAARYTARRVETGWCVYENEQPIAFCTEQAYALAIANALGLHRAAAAGRLLVVPPPVDHFLS